MQYSQEVDRSELFSACAVSVSSLATKPPRLPKPRGKATEEENIKANDRDALSMPLLCLIFMILQKIKQKSRKKTDQGNKKIRKRMDRYE